MKLALDHLVVAARSLDEGVAWCEARLGITPGPGGQHDFMGTHNRLFSIASPVFPRAYFEIIAIDPDGAAPVTPRWFDLDQPALQAVLEDGPTLVHWMARTDALARVREDVAAAGIDIGALRHAQRSTAHGLLTWQIAIRPDGLRLFDGAFPGLIEWGDVHPTDRMPPSGVQLEGVVLRGTMNTPQAWWPAGVHQHPDTAAARGGPLEATLSTPRGRVVLAAPDL